MQQYEKLFSEGQIGTVQLKNRVVMSPMVLGTGGLDGTPGEQMMQYYEERAKGGVGLSSQRPHVLMKSMDRLPPDSLQ